MNKKQLNLLAKAFESEMLAAVGISKIPLLQTKSSEARALVQSGHLVESEVSRGGVAVRGFELTHLGRLAYCQSCDASGASNSAVTNKE